MHGRCYFEKNLNQTNSCTLKKHSPVVLLTSKTLHFHQYSADVTYFVPLARELFLTFREKCQLGASTEYSVSPWRSENVGNTNVSIKCMETTSIRPCLFSVYPFDRQRGLEPYL